MFELEKLSRDLGLKEEKLTPEFLKDYCSYMFDLSSELLNIVSRRYGELINAESENVAGEKPLTRFLILKDITESIENLNYMRKEYDDMYAHALEKEHEQEVAKAIEEENAKSTSTATEAIEATETPETAVEAQDSAKSLSCK